MVRTGLREMFDLVTFLKPVHVLVEENRKIYAEIIRLIFVVFIYWAVSSILVFAFNYNTWYVTLAANSVVFAVYLFVVLVQIPVGSFVSYIISRFFSQKGDILNLITVNYFLAASASLLILVGFLPYAEFASLILTIMGFALYMYFLNEIFEKIFSISPMQSLILLVFYLAFPALILALYWFLTGNLNLNVSQL